MTSTAHDDQDLADLTPAEALSALAEERRCADAAEARMLVLAAHWVDLHPGTTRFTAPHGVAGVVLSESTVEVPLAGVGTPGVSEYAVEALAATLGLSYAAGLRLVSEAVELRHRLPRLWSLVHAGRLQAWKARQVAHETTTLSKQAVEFVDRQLAVVAGRNRTLTVPKLKELVHEAMLRCDPDQAAGVEQAALAARGVWFDHRQSTATTDVTARLDTLDALDLEASVGDLAGVLGRLGDERPLDVRQATALGMLAHPQRALDLVAAAETRTGADQTDQTDQTEPPKSHAPAPGLNGFRATLFVHVTTADLVAGTGGRVDRVGPATLGLLGDWLARVRSLTVRPVLDLARDESVDAHDPPEWMRELVVQRDGHCVFPGCTISARACDLDHIRPYRPPDEGGPPGQTSPANLAPLCRRHHRLKTFTAWTYRRLPDGDYEWTDPHAHRHVVTAGL